MKRSSLIGNRSFYRRVFLIVLPIIVRMLVGNFVNLLDNVMVGRLGTEEISAVSIVNQLVFVFNLAIFGGLSGAGIFTAQFYGARDVDGVRYTVRVKLYVAVTVLVVALIILTTLRDPLIMLYLHDQSGESMRKTLEYGREYLQIVRFGLPAFAVAQCYSGTLEECGETRIPMVAAVAEVFTNALLNYVLIYGKFGLPELRVRGAALATVLSRFVGLGILTIYSHTHTKQHVCFKGLYKSFRIPGDLVGKMLRKGGILLINEVLWSMSVTTLTQQYSRRGLIVVAALSISSTVTNIFSVLYASMGNAISIMVGQELGANRHDEARSTAWKLTALGVASCFVVGALMGMVATVIPKLYNLEEEARSLATAFMTVAACIMPLECLTHCAYFTLRSGGKTLITFLYDCCFNWVILVPLAYVLVRYTSMDILTVFILCNLTTVLKAIYGVIMVKKGVWIQNIVEKT